MKLNLKSQNASILIKNDEVLKEICLKKFSDLSDEEFDLLRQCKCKVVKETRVFNNTSSTTYKACLELCKGVIVYKRLRDDEVTSILLNNPSLITNGQADVSVPVKLTCFESKNDPTKMRYKYSAIISPNVYMGMSKSSSSGDTGYLNDRTINNVVASSLAYKDDISFIKLESSDFDMLDNIESKIAEMDLDEF